MALKDVLLELSSLQMPTHQSEFWIELLDILFAVVFVFYLNEVVLD